jgi:PadR family transcriptional regulator
MTDSPLTPATLHILLTLSETDAHGYAIKKAVEQRTDNAIRLGSGTLYEGIQRMTASGWIKEVAVRGVGAGGAPRRVYRITASGRRILTAELERLASIVDFARDRHLVPEGRR